MGDLCGKVMLVSGHILINGLNLGQVGKKVIRTRFQQITYLFRLLSMYRKRIQRQRQTHVLGD